MSREPGRLLPDYAVRGGLVGSIWGFFVIGAYNVMRSDWGQVVLSAIVVVALFVALTRLDREIYDYEHDNKEHHADDL